MLGQCRRPRVMAPLDTHRPTSAGSSRWRPRSGARRLIHENVKLLKPPSISPVARVPSGFIDEARALIDRTSDAAPTARPNVGRSISQPGRNPLGHGWA